MLRRGRVRLGHSYRRARRHRDSSAWLFDYTANVVPDLAIALLLYLFMPSRGAGVPSRARAPVDRARRLDLALRAPLAQGAMFSTAAAFVLVNLLGWVAGDSMTPSSRRR